MKIIFSIGIMLFISGTLYSQDVIIKTTGDEFQAKIIEITDDAIKYKDYHHQEGPIRNINKTAVFMVIYENGTRETFTPAEPQKQQKENSTPLKKPKPSDKSDFRGKYMQASAGYGNSYGGIGLNFAMRFGGVTGYGFHAGVGYIIDGNAAGVAGFKFYPYKNLYINALFGIVGYEITIYKGWYYYTTKQALYGPALLFGGEWAWGSKVKYGFNIAAGYRYLVNYKYIEPNKFAFDTGFIIKF